MSIGIYRDLPQPEPKPDPNYPRYGDVVEVVGVTINPDGSGCLLLDGGRHLNFETSPADLPRLTGYTLALTSGTVLLGGGVKARRIAERLSPKRIKFVGTPVEWFGRRWEKLI